MIWIQVSLIMNTEIKGKYIPEALSCESHGDNFYLLNKEEYFTCRTECTTYSKDGHLFIMLDQLSKDDHGPGFLLFTEVWAYFVFLYKDRLFCFTIS